MTFTTGKRIVITGGNSGIGFETARNLSREAGEIILVCRNKVKAAEAQHSLQKEHPGTQVSVVISDLSSPRSIREAASYLQNTWASIDVLINNAGGIFFRRMETDDGLEYTFGLNHMGFFRLTLALLPLLEASDNGRIINLSSIAHQFAALNFQDLQHTKSYRGFLVYSRSKLANILFTRELARRLDPRRITAAAVHPGFIRSGFAADTGKTVGGVLFHTLALVVGETPSVGAITPTYLARKQDITHGGYYANRTLIRPSKHALDDHAAKRLWDISEKLTEQ